MGFGALRRDVRRPRSSAGAERHHHRQRGGGDHHDLLGADRGRALVAGRCGTLVSRRTSSTPLRPCCGPSSIPRTSATMRSETPRPASGRRFGPAGWRLRCPRRRRSWHRHPTLPPSHSRWPSRIRRPSRRGPPPRKRRRRGRPPSEHELRSRRQATGEPERDSRSGDRADPIDALTNNGKTVMAAHHRPFSQASSGWAWRQFRPRVAGQCLADVSFKDPGQGVDSRSFAGTVGKLKR